VLGLRPPCRISRSPASATVIRSATGGSTVSLIRCGGVLSRQQNPLVDWWNAAKPLDSEVEGDEPLEAKSLR
jgi:hypothetical protein